LLVTGCHI